MATISRRIPMVTVELFGDDVDTIIEALNRVYMAAPRPEDTASFRRRLLDLTEFMKKAKQNVA